MAESDDEFIFEQDWFLRGLVAGVNADDVELGITLNVGGLVISGVLVGGKKYFEGISEQIREEQRRHFPEEGGENWLSDLFEKFGQSYEKEEVYEEEGENPIIQFIHLKNARFYDVKGNSIPTKNGVWWRGRISSVDGFTLGTVSMDSSEE